MGNCNVKESLFTAIEAGDIVRFRALLPHAGPLNFRQRATGQPLLHTAILYAPLAQKEHEFIHELLQADREYDLEQVDNDGRTALYIASLSGAQPIVSLLLAAGASTTRASLEGTTPFLAACWRGHLEVVKLLVDAGANISHKDHNGRSGADLASEWNHSAVVEWLSARGQHAHTSAHSSQSTDELHIQMPDQKHIQNLSVEEKHQLDEQVPHIHP